MGIITLYKDEWQDAYMANMSQASRAQEINRVFGTTTIPTCYTLRARAETVQSEIQALNPNDTVLLDQPRALLRGGEIKP